MKHLSRLVGIVCLVLMGIILSSGLVWAIGNPNSVTIGDAYVFRNVLSTGDQLYFVRYDVEYTGNVSEDADDTWQMALYNSAGTLVATRPLNYYQHNIISIYLTSNQSLTWQGAHSVRIMGMPSVFPILTEGINMRTRNLAPGDYKELADLGGIMLTQAGILQADWGITILSSDLLNTTGGTYFTKAVPNLGSMAPQIFQTSVGYPSVTYQSFNQTYPQELQQHEGAQLRQAVTDVGGWLGISEGWMGFWSLIIIYLMVGSVIFPSVGNPGWAVIGAYPILALGAWLGIGTADMFTLVIVLILLTALCFGIFFILGRFG